VHDCVKAPRERTLKDRPLGDVALYELDGGIRVWLEIDDPNVRARARKCSNDMTADEPRAPGDEDPPPAWGAGGHRAVGVRSVTAR
jgi:hypothetical protein